MKAAHNYVVILVTVPDVATARQLAQAALGARLTACANIIPKIESHYWWHDKLEHSAEVLLLLKTTRSRVKSLERCILQRHPYDTAEFLALPVQAGTQRYLDWITSSCHGRPLTQINSPRALRQ